MKRFCLMLLLVTAFTITSKAQNRFSVYIDNANRYASVELSDFCDRLCIEFNTSNYVLNNYYRHCGYNWGDVSLVFEVARTLGVSPKRVLSYYKRYRPYGWDRIIAEIGIYPGSPYYNPFNDRIIVYNNYWCEHYNDYYAHRHNPRPPRDHHNPPPPRKPNDNYKHPDKPRRPEYYGKRDGNGRPNDRYDKPRDNGRQDYYGKRNENDRRNDKYNKPNNNGRQDRNNRREGNSSYGQNNGGSKYRRR